VIEHRRPGITVVDKDKQTALLIDITIPWDARVDEKEQEKIDKYLKTLRWNLVVESENKSDSDSGWYRCSKNITQRPGE